MATLTIELDRTSARPGNEISGRVRWTLADAPRSARLRLYWTTIGEEPHREETVHDLDAESLLQVGVSTDGSPYRDGGGGAGHLRATDCRAFTFVAPESPYSFRGVLFGLTWRVAARLEPGGHTAEASFALSPRADVLELNESAE